MGMLNEAGLSLNDPECEKPTTSVLFCGAVQTYMAV